MTCWQVRHGCGFHVAYSDRIWYEDEGYCHTIGVINTSPDSKWCHISHSLSIRSLNHTRAMESWTLSSPDKATAVKTWRWH